MIGIAMAAILLASVSAAMVPMSGTTGVSWLPKLTAELSTTEIDPGDTFTVSGNATELEIEQVDIITLAPCGGRGKGMNGSAGTYIPITPGYVTVPATIPGITYVTASVSEDDTFSKEIHVHEDAEPGNYSVIVLHPGRDGYYGWGIPNGSMLLPAIVRDYCSGKAPGFLCRTQAQLLAIIEDATTWTAGSDDLMVALQIKVKGTPTPCPTPCVSLDPISAIEVGDPLRVTGSTCRGDTPILITVWGPDYTSQVVQPTGGKFEATFDTEGIVPGTYGVRAEDIEEGYCDVTTVEVLSELPEKTTVSISTDKYIYTSGDTMTITIDFENPKSYAVDTYFLWYLKLPDYGYEKLVMSTPLTLPAYFELPYTVSIPIGDLGAYSFDATWYVALRETTLPYEIISEDSANWCYVPGAAVHGGVMPIEIAEEITKEIEGVEFAT